MPLTGATGRKIVDAGIGLQHITCSICLNMLVTSVHGKLIRTGILVGQIGARDKKTCANGHYL